MKPIIIVPYVHDAEIQKLKNRLSWKLDVEFWKDESGIGSDLAYEYLWNKYPDRDVIILHSDMEPMLTDKTGKWYSDLLKYVKKYPEAGILGMKLLYPTSDEEGNLYIQSVGGAFENGEAVHNVGTVDLYTGGTRGSLEADKGQYDNVYEVPWTTFGGLYIRRKLLEQCKYFDRSYHYTYYRDVDQCLRARQLGWKVYQVPVPFLHFEGKDNKVIMQQNPVKSQLANLNKEIFWEKWKDNELISNFMTKVGDKL